MRIVFKHAHRDLRGVDTRTAALENFVTCRERAFQPGAIFALSLRCYLASLNGAGAAVDRESDSLWFHVWLMIWASFCGNGGRSDRFFVGYPESFRDCTKEHESKEAISYESRPEFHRVNVMACPEQCRRVSHAC